MRHPTNHNINIVTKTEFHALADCPCAECSAERLKPTVPPGHALLTPPNALAIGIIKPEKLTEEGSLARKLALQAEKAN